MAFEAYLNQILDKHYLFDSPSRLMVFLIVSSWFYFFILRASVYRILYECMGWLRSIRKSLSLRRHKEKNTRKSGESTNFLHGKTS